MTVFDWIIEVKISKDDLTFISFALKAHAEQLNAMRSQTQGTSENWQWDDIDTQRVIGRLEDLSQRLIKASRGEREGNV